MKQLESSYKNHKSATRGPNLSAARLKAAARRFWDELHSKPFLPIGHPIPRLTPPIPSSRFKVQGSRFKVSPLATHSSILLLPVLAFLATGCQVLTYTSPNGERFSRGVLGTATAISSLSVDTDTNGLRRVELRGYQNDSAQALGVVTEAAVKAALGK
jgi:hypothetical protein